MVDGQISSGKNFETRSIRDRIGDRRLESLSVQIREGGTRSERFSPYLQRHSDSPPSVEQASVSSTAWPRPLVGS